MGHGFKSLQPEAIKEAACQAREQQASEDKRPLEVAYFGGTFTAFAPDEQERYLEVAKRLKDQGVIDAVRISTHPGHISAAICGRLAAHGVDWVEVGVQSFASRPLRKSGRGYDEARAREACRQVQQAGIGLVIQLMPFLPGATETDDVESAHICAAIEPDAVRLFPTVVLRNTGLFDLMRAGRYAPATLEEAVDRCALMLEPLDRRKIPILRIGLQASEMTGAQVEAGPYHPALGELVRGAFLADRLADFITARPTESVYRVCVENSLASLLTGHKGRSVNRLQRRLGGAQLDISAKLPGTHGSTTSARRWTGGTFEIEDYTSYLTVARASHGD